MSLKNFLPFLLVEAMINNEYATKHDYVPDGKPRVPKIGDIIKIEGVGFVKVKRVRHGKQQVYKKK